MTGLAAWERCGRLAARNSGHSAELIARTECAGGLRDRLSQGEKILMGKVDRSLGRELRRRREAEGHTHDSLAAIIGVTGKTVGKWERGEAMPSATNIRALEKLGLIEDWLGRNGSGNKQDRQCAPSRTTDRIMGTPGQPRSEQRVRVQQVQDGNERELLTLFRTFAADERKTILKIFQLVVAKPGLRN